MLSWPSAVSLAFSQLLTSTDAGCVIHPYLMSFNSFDFYLFLAIALTGHALLNGKAMQVWLCVMSYLCYGWGHPWWYVGLLFFSNVLDYVVSRRIDATDDPRQRKLWLACSVIGNLGVLTTFKYLGFIARSLNRLIPALTPLDLQLPVPDLSLPPGISFYTFQTLSYTIDVYRRQIKPERSLVKLGLFVSYFPTLVAGPIERGTDLLGQLDQKRARTSEDVFLGVSRILWGLTKKIVFADWLGLYVAHVYGDAGRMAAGHLLLATYAFAFQIYLDFSAYSDIAWGIGRLMGHRIIENFRWPYLARNISEFWRRWHISFSTWLRDYLYIPLGGSRRGHVRTVINVFIVMLLGGLWHGAEMKFILWGLWIGLGLACFHAYTLCVPRDRDAAQPVRWRDAPAVLLTFHWICVSWVFFRAGSIGEALMILRRIGSAWGPGAVTVPSEIVIRTVVFLSIVVLVHIFRGMGGRLLRWERLRRPVAVGILWGALIITMALFYAPSQEPFIYFQF